MPSIFNSLFLSPVAAVYQSSIAPTKVSNPQPHSFFTSPPLWDLTLRGFGVGVFGDPLAAWVEEVTVRFAAQ